MNHRNLILLTGLSLAAWLGNGVSPACVGGLRADEPRTAMQQVSESAAADRNAGAAKESDAKTPAEPVSLAAVERNIVEKTNRWRQRHGLRPLQIDLHLMKSARRHTGWMTRNRRLQHTSAPVAENIAWGQRNSDEALRSWMGSPGHRANILNPRYRKIGVAAYVASDGSVYWCQQFK